MTQATEDTNEEPQITLEFELHLTNLEITPPNNSIPNFGKLFSYQFRYGIFLGRQFILM